MKKYTKSAFSHELFRDPEPWYRGVPFWSWNCMVDDKKIQRDVQVFRDMGFGGADIHCRYGLQNRYLSDSFMELVQRANRELQKNGLLTWLYDEDRWPSGAAGGLIARPENASRCMLFTPQAQTGFCKDKENFYARQKSGEDPDGFFLAKYEVLLKDGKMDRYERCDEREQPAFGGGFWYAYLALERNDIWYSSFGYVDTLNPRVIREFRDITYERYARAVGKEFGKSVAAIFTDEPQFAYKETLAQPQDRKDVHLSYTDDMEQTFQQAHGYSLLDHVPELIWELPDNRVSAVRYHYHDHVADRFYLSYFKQLYDWCDQHGIQFTGHAVEESTLWSQTRAIGEAMRCYHGLHIPGVDILCDAREYTTVKQAQSVSRQDGRDGVMSELYGVTNWDFTMRGHKVQGDWQTAMGVTHRVLSLSLMSLEGGAKRDFPASLSYQLPWYKEYKTLETYFARVNTAMLAGKAVVRTGVIHPIESYWLHWGPMRQTADVRDEMEERFKNLIEWLSFGLLDFDFISESLLPHQYKAGQDGFTVGEMQYDVVLVPACETLRRTTYNALREFQARGGRVVFLETVPSLMDAEPTDEVKQFAADCEVIPFSRVAILRALEPVREVDCIRPDSGRRARDMLYQLREEANGHKYLFLCNVTQHEKPNFFEITGKDLPRQDCEVSVRGTYSVNQLDPLTGQIRDVPCIQIHGTTVFRQSFYAAQSGLYELVPANAAASTQLPAFEKQKKRLVCELQAEEFWLEEPNVLLLDRPAYSVNGGERRPKEEILRIQGLLNEELGYNRGWAQPWADPNPDERPDQVCMEFEIESEVADAAVSLGAERPEYLEIVWNGTPVEVKENGYYVDESIQKIPLGKLRKGKNFLTVYQKVGPKSYLEAFYLLGRFGVTCEGAEPRITAMPSCLAYGDIGSQGLCFYGGTYVQKSSVELQEKGRYRLSVHDFSAPLLGVVVDGKRVGTIFTAPYEADLGVLEAGRHTVDLIVFGNRYNTFGPLHNSDPAYDWWGDNAWRTQGAYFAYEYHFRPVGIFTAPRLFRVEQA